jgi:hypothetical protein
MSEAKAKGRRAFLRSMAAAGGAAAVAAASEVSVVQAAPAEEISEPKAPAKARGYHVTPHIETYYRLAEF